MPTIVRANTAAQIPTAPVNGKLTVVYWDICGLQQPIRYALEVAGADYVDVRVHWGPGEPDTDSYKQLWFDKKPVLANILAFPNLPYLLDADGVSLTQSNAILKYIGRKYSHESSTAGGCNLLGDSSSAHLIDLVLDQAADFDAQFTRLAYMEGLPGLASYCKERLKGELAGWERMLGVNPFMTGDDLTVADLKVYETLRKLLLTEMDAGIDANTWPPSLMSFVHRVENVPAIRDYQASSRYMKRPLNNEHAKYK